jgi:hypothetical protein
MSKKTAVKKLKEPGAPRTSGKFVPGKCKLKVKRSTAGLGLYAQESIAKGTCIIEYTGRRITKKEEETVDSLYLFDVPGYETINGTLRSNTARYINHSCRPNCEIEIYQGHVYVMAKRNIKEGEELAYDYDKEFFNEYIKPKGCRCIKCQPALYTK